MRQWRNKSERLCCFCVLSHSDGAMSWCDDLSLFDDRCTVSEFTRGQNDELVRSHGRPQGSQTWRLSELAFLKKKSARGRKNEILGFWEGSNARQGLS